MKKTTSYFEDDVYSEIEDIASKEKRSFNKVLGMLVSQALKEKKRLSEKNKKKNQKEE